MRTPSSVQRARLVLLGLLLLVIAGLLPASRPGPRRLPPAGRGDAVLHLATIERIRAGSPYYEAVGAELRRLDYPATSIFNWRTPAHFELVALLSVPLARLVLRVLTIAVLVLIPAALAGRSRVVTGLALFSCAGALATAVQPQAVVAGEVWAGVLIAWSICAYYRGLDLAGAAAGIAAVFMREIAAPYCLACGLVALCRRRTAETALWMTSGAAYLAYFAYHAMQVRAHQLPGDLTQAESWLRWNGLAFIVSTAKVNAWLGEAPQWLVVICVIVAIAGVWSRMPVQVRASLAAYVMLFAVAGQPFNFYWGYVTAPVWAFAFAHGAEGFEQLVNAARPIRAA